MTDRSDASPPHRAHSRLAEIESLRGASELPWTDPRFREQLSRVLALSDWANSVLQQAPEFLSNWQDGAPAAPDCYQQALQTVLDDDLDEPAMMRILRRFRNQALLTILWRDVNGADDLNQVLQRLSDLADAMIDAAFRWAGRQMETRHGQALDAAGEPEQIVVIGMGKLGGGELNFSSDVDLILAFPQAGETDGARPLSNEEYFARQGRLATRLLADQTEDGFVYRVDYRLRPFGEAGRLALSFAAMEQYYQRDGRDWERYAWIKARPVAGDRQQGQRLLGLLRPFVYRRYLDFSAFEALREMKAMIRAEVERRDLDGDVKLGAGGIREVEFIVQAFQLIRGGRQRDLQERRLRTVLVRLAEAGLIETGLARDLDRAYCFLRVVENRLQQRQDAQTHRLPEDDVERAIVAESMGFPDWTALQVELDRQRALIRSVFGEVFEPETTTVSRGARTPWSDLWPAAGDASQSVAVFAEAGFADPQAAAELLAGFRNGSGYRSLGERARRRMDRFVPGLLATVDQAEDQDRALAAVIQVVRAVAARSAYVSLLSERPKVLERLVDLCGRSPWLTDLIARHPLLLDELLDHRFTEPDLRPDVIRQGMATRLATVEAGDQEGEMESLRFTRQSHAMMLAAGLLDGRLGTPLVARSLTDLAEAALDQVSGLAWRDVTERYGELAGVPAGLAIIGYGTLGGRELNFTSDLDLVFLHHGGDVTAATDGSRSIGLERFYLRLTQRILHTLQTLTPAGRLYEVDVRLRPNGQSGFLVSGVQAFAEYQLSEAWVWELQALCRARWVAGDPRLRGPFEAARRAALARPRELGELNAAVVEMRERMRRELDRSNAHSFDLKQGAGGKVDIEFLSQWARLRWYAQYPELLAKTGTIESLRACADLGLMEGAMAADLCQAYADYQRAAQLNALAELAQRVPDRDLHDQRESVQAAWRECLD